MLLDGISEGLAAGKRTSECTLPLASERLEETMCLAGLWVGLAWKQANQDTMALSGGHACCCRSASRALGLPSFAAYG